MALDPDGNRLFVINGNEVLVQDLADRTRPPGRLSLGPAVPLQAAELGEGQDLPMARLQVELGDAQDIRFAYQLVHDGAKRQRRDSLTWRVEQGFRTGFHVWLPETKPDAAPQFFRPEDLDKMEKAAAAVEHGGVIAIGGRMFGDPVTPDAKPGQEVASDDDDAWLGRQWKLLDNRGRLATLSGDAWPGTPLTEWTRVLLRLRTLQPNAQLLRFLQRFGAPTSTLDVARHGDVFMLVAVNGGTDSSKALHLAAERAVKGFKACGTIEKLIAIDWQFCQHGLLTGLAYDRHRKTLLVATTNRLLDWDTVADTKSWKKVDDDWARRIGDIVLDQDRGQLYFTTEAGARCLDVGDSDVHASLPVAGIGNSLQGVKHMAQHREWLLVTHAGGVAVVDQGRVSQLEIAYCRGAVASAIVSDRVAVIFEHDVRLAGWSIGDIGARLALVAAGGAPEQPPAPVPWIGLGCAGFPTPGLPPQKTALTGIAGVLEHRGEVFVAHDRGVFSVPLTPPPLRVSPEESLTVDAFRGWPDDFVIVPAASACQYTANVRPFHLADVQKGPTAPLWMSPMLQPARGTRWAAVLPLQVPSSAMIIGLAPVDDCLANADLLFGKERHRAPRVDGLLVHQPDASDDSSRAVRLHEVVKEEGGKWAWSMGADLLRKLQEKVGMVDERSPPFFMGDSEGNMAIELEGSCRPNDRGGVAYQLLRVRLRGLERASKVQIDLIEKPLKEFVVGQSRPVRFYVCTLGGESAGAGVSLASTPRACLQWVPEHLPYMQLLEGAKA